MWTSGPPKDAAAKLKALDKFSGREIAKALMVDKAGEFVWGKGFFGLNATAKAVKAAVEAQEKFSEELGKLNDRLAGSKDVTAEMQDAFTELQFQCDRRATEIYSVAVRMHDRVQKDVVNRADADPQVAAYLDATFKELMPREAILLLSTAGRMESASRIEVSCNDRGTAYAIYAADGAIPVQSAFHLRAVRHLRRAGQAPSDHGMHHPRLLRGSRRRGGADAPGGRLSFRGFCGTYEVETTSNGRTVKRQFHVGLKPDGERRAALEKVKSPCSSSTSLSHAPLLAFYMV